MKKSLFLLFATGSLAACSGGATGPKQDVDNTLRNQASFCNQWAKAACNDNVVSDCNETDKDTCVANQESFCETLVPSTGYSSKRAKDCIDAVRAAYADTELDAAELDVVLRLGGDCAHLVAGPDKMGEVCSEPNDCDTVHDYTCVIKAGDATGTCQIPMIQQNGEPCDGLAMVCNAEAYCDGANCLVRKAAGKTCAYDAMCEDGNVCTISDASTDATGTCTAKLALRAACTQDSECASNICLAGKCTSKVVVTAGSAVCDNL